jgi:cyclophilin family peptidyl-prolyl cis-trans isomerase
MMKFGKMKLLTLFFTVLLVLLTACGNKPADNKQGSTATPAAATPSATATDTSTPKQYSKPPEMKIDPAKSYQADVVTSKGSFTIELFAKDAPKTVNNFVFLSKEGFYNNVVFHRIIKSFMIQTGDPLGTGRGGPGYKFDDELNSPYKYEPGIVAMANSGKNTNGSQFFICSGADCTNLNSMPNYTIFGKVTVGMDTITNIASTPVKQGAESSPSVPTEKVTIQSITIKEK